MSDASILAAELFVNDKAASEIILKFYEKLKKTDADIGKIGENSKFGKHLSDQLSVVEKKADSLVNRVKNIGSDLQSYVLGVLA